MTAVKGVSLPARGGTSQRGYGRAHQLLRAGWAPTVAAGLVRCWRCGELIAAGAPWDLGHDDEDRSIYRGPEHPRCNRATGGGRAPVPRRHSRVW